MAQTPLIDTLQRSIEALAAKASQSMKNILNRSLAKPIDPSGLISKCELTVTRKSNTIIEVSTDFPQYAYWANRGRGTGLIPPDKPIRDWVKAHNISEDAVFPIRRKMAQEGSKRFRENNPVGMFTPLERMIEMIKKTISVDAVTIMQHQIYTNAKVLEDISFKL